MECEGREEAEGARETKEEAAEAGKAATGEGLGRATTFSVPGTWTTELVRGKGMLLPWGPGQRNS